MQTITILLALSIKTLSCVKLSQNVIILYMTILKAYIGYVVFIFSYIFISNSVLKLCHYQQVEEATCSDSPSKRSGEQNSGFAINSVAFVGVDRA